MARDKQALKKGTSVVGGVVLEWRAVRGPEMAEVTVYQGHHGTRCMPRWAQSRERSRVHLQFCTHLFTCTVRDSCCDTR